MRNRILVMALGFLVLALTLAGFLGFLDMLSQNVDAGLFQPEDVSSTTTHLPATGKADKLRPVLTTSEVQVVLPRQVSLEGGTTSHLPLFEVTGAAHTSYLRSTVASVYDGRMWKQADQAQSQRYSGEVLIPRAMAAIHGQGFIRTDEIRVSSLVEFTAGTVPLPTSLYSTQVTSALPLVYFPEEQLFYSEGGLPDAYSFWTSHFDFDLSALNQAGVADGAGYLELPPDISARTRALALTITRSGGSAYQKAKAIETYLKANYTYGFDYRDAPAGWDPNDWFLFEERKGVCTHFNSVFVILCRSAGIPARLVAGFVITPQAEPQVVYADQAHAWAEVRFQELDWYTFDATGGRPRPIPTSVEITSIGSSIQKGLSFSIEGMVQAANGDMVDGVGVEVFISSRKQTRGGLLIGQGTASHGYFNIEAAVPLEARVGDYHVLAHSLGDTRYQESWSDPKIKVFTATTLNMKVPRQVKVQELAAFSGSLVEESGAPVVGQPVDIYVGDTRLARLVTDAEGQFLWERAFSRAGDYTVKASFPGTDYWLGSSQEVELQVLVPTAISLDVVSPYSLAQAQAYKPLLIVGSLSQEITGAPIPDQGITILINGRPLASRPETDSNGAFELEYTFESVGRYWVEARFSGVPLYGEAAVEREVMVSAPSALVLTVPRSAGVEAEVPIEGLLQDAKTGKPIAGESILLSMEGSLPAQEVATNKKGSFKLEPVFEQEGLYRVEAMFQGSPFYWPCVAGGDLKIVPPQAGFPWLYLLLGMAPVMTGVGGLFIYRRQRQHRSLFVPLAARPVPAFVADRLPRIEKTGPRASLSIEFPRIESPFPDVWGLGDELEVVCRLTGPGGEGMASRPLEVYVDKELAGRVASDGQGLASWRCTFTRRGQYELGAVFQGEPGMRQIVAVRSIRIVDYREEIVNLFGALLDWLRQQGVELPDNATPREAGDWMLKTMTGMPHEALDRVVGGFEEADYSLHPMDRRNYQIVYLALEEVRRHGGEPRGTP